MAYIGNTPTTQAFTPAIDYFSGNASTTAFTLSKPVASVAQVQVVVDNVAQNPSSAYTVSGQTITFTSAPLSGTNNIYVYYTSPITQVIAPGQGTVNSTSFASSTGSGAVVLATSPTVSAPTLTGTSTFAGGVANAYGFGVGTAVPTSGSGVAFPATQNPSSDPNTLDDYEEGTWTPSIGGNATYVNQNGQYTKIGNFVKLKFHLEINVKGTGSATTITGMPFVPAGSDPVIVGGTVCYIANLATAALSIGIYAQSSNNIYFFTRDTSSTGSTTQQPSVIGNGTNAYCEISYLV